MSIFSSRGARAPKKLVADEAGHSLIEMLVAVTMMISFLTLAFGFHSVFAADQRRIDSTVRNLNDSKTGLDGLSRQLRQALQVCSSWPTCGAFTGSPRIDFQRCVSVGPSGCTSTWVRYDCTGIVPPGPTTVTTRACLRSEAIVPSDLGKNAQVVIRNLASAPSGVFSFTSPDYVGISLRIMARGMKNPIAVNDGVQLRNLDL
jgi:hypothetical protein